MPGFQSEYQIHSVSSDEIHPGILSLSTNNPLKKSSYYSLCKFKGQWPVLDPHTQKRYHAIS